VELERRLEASSIILSARARATHGLWSYRFFGYGNDSPEIRSRDALVAADEVRLTSGMTLELGEDSEVFFGPVVRYLKPDPDPDGPLSGSSLPGARSWGQVGVISEIDLQNVDDQAFPRSGVRLLTSTAAYAPVWTSSHWFGGASGELRGYLPLPFRSTLASRVGGAVALGDFPVHEAAFLGGRRSLRSELTDRYAGDSSLFGSTELRFPLGRVTLLTRGTLGGLVFADAGRVYVSGDSPGGWHTGWGGGLWYRTMGVSGALLYGVGGEQPRLQAYFGLPF
jgi:hypothetical protein